MFYFDVVAKRSRWRIPRNEITIKTKDEDDDEVVKIFREDTGDNEGEWYRVEHHLLTRPYWFRNDSETKERQWEKPLQKAASKEKAVETTEEEEESEEEDDDIEFDPDAYENEEGKEQFHQRAAFVAAGQKRNRLSIRRAERPRRLQRAPLSSKRKKKKKKNQKRIMHRQNF